MRMRDVEKNFQLYNKQLLDEVFVISGIIKFDVSVISRAEPKAEADSTYRYCYWKSCIARATDRC